MFRAPILLFLAAALVLVGCAHRGVNNLLSSSSPAKHSTTSPVQPASHTPSAHAGESTHFLWQDVHFAFDRSDLDEQARVILEGTGAHLVKRPEFVELQGNCDERGSVEYNLALGERRARSVKAWLVSYGIPATDLTTISFGKERPLDTAHDEAAWAKNRRVHFEERGQGS